MNPIPRYVPGLGVSAFFNVQNSPESIDLPEVSQGSSIRPATGSENKTLKSLLQVQGGIVHGALLRGRGHKVDWYRRKMISNFHDHFILATESVR